MSDNKSSSSGKSKEEIAFEILSKLKGVGVWGENNKDAILDMYAECLVAASGLRPVKGQTSSHAPAPTHQSAPPREYAPVQNVRSPAKPTGGMTPLQAELHNLQKALGE